MGQRSHIEFPDPITINGLTTCREEVSHGNDGNAFMPGAFEFGPFLFSNGADICVMVFQSFNELGIFISMVSPGSTLRISLSRK